MKKRMFLSTILMALVLLVAVTTATFAWYSVTEGAASYQAGAAGTVTTQAGTYELGSSTVTLSFTNVTAPAELSNAAGKTYYVDDNYAYEKGVAASQQVGSAGLVANWNDENEEAHKAMAGQTIAAVITASGQVKLVKDNTNAADANLVENGQIPVTITVGVDGSLTVNVTTVYFVVRPVKSSIDKTTDSGNFGVDTATGGSLLATAA